MQYRLCLCQERHVWRVSWTCLLVHFGRFCVFGSVLLMLSVFESNDVWNTVSFVLVSKKAVMDSMLLIILYRAHTCSIVSASLRRCLWGVSTIFYMYRLFSISLQGEACIQRQDGGSSSSKNHWHKWGKGCCLGRCPQRGSPHFQWSLLTYKLVTQWYRPARRYIISYRYCICVFYRPAYIDIGITSEFYRPAYRYIISYRYCICVFFNACTDLSLSCAGNSGRLARVKTYKLYVGHAVV